MIMYATGLRVSETLHLALEDVDSCRMVLRVQQGKGRKDRYVPISPTLLEALQGHRVVSSSVFREICPPPPAVLPTRR